MKLTGTEQEWLDLVIGECTRSWIDLNLRNANLDDSRPGEIVGELVYHSVAEGLRYYIINKLSSINTRFVVASEKVIEDDHQWKGTGGVRFIDCHVIIISFNVFGYETGLWGN